MISRILFTITALLLISMPAVAAQPKISIAAFKVTGTTAKDELKDALQSMLASRLAAEKIQVVGTNDSPDMTVIGTYIVFGKVFSLDGQLVARNGKVLGRAFEQGESADDVIPAVGRLARKLTEEIGRIPLASLQNAGSSNDSLQPQALPVTPPVSADIVRKPPAEVSKKDEEIIRPEKVIRNSESGMISQRLDGAMIGLVQVGRSDKGSREVVVALEKELRMYRQEKEFKLLAAENNFGGNEKIISIDIADLDADGVQELYVTAFNGELLASKVYLLENGSFRKIAADIPYFFRGIALNGGAYKVYAQEMGINDDFYGDMCELVKKGTSFQLGKPVKLPPKGNIYNVNLFADKDGKPLFVTLNPDGYLVVSAETGESLWKSSDKFGGSEMYFTRDDMQNVRVTGSQYRKRFIEQRITVTKNGVVIVPKNEGSFVIGNSRSFSKNSVYAFAWNGAGLDELWHTRLDQSYLADYSYDNEQKELLILEVVKKAGIVEKGASAVVVRRVE